MQFQALSTSYGASNPRDQFIIQALSSRDAAERDEDDEREERRLRAQEQKRLREERKRRPSVLSSYIADSEQLEPFDEEEGDEAALEDASFAGSDDEESARAPALRSENDNDGDRLSPRKSPSSQQHLGVHARRPSSGSSKKPPHSPSESTPLIPSRRLSTSTLTPKPLQRVFKSPTVGATRKEFTILIWYTIPIFITHLLEYSLLLATIVSVGHLGTAELAASSLGSMTTNVCALSIIQGLCAALDTLCSQAYSSPHPKTTSLHALRTAFITVIVLIPASIVICNGERLLLALKQDPEVAKLAGAYLRILVFGLPGYAGFEICRRWLQAQGLMIVPTISLAVAAPINIFLNWLLVWGPEKVRLGFIGAPVSTAVSFNIMFFICIAYCIWLAPRDAWGGFSWAIVQDLRPNIILGLAGFASIASEWWAWEIVGISSAYIGTDNLGANSVLGTSASLLYQLPYALSVAAAVRVGNLVGAGYPYAARLSSKTSWTLSAIIGTINSSLLLLLKKRWGRLFSSDDRVVQIVANVIPLVGVFQLADGVTGAAMGVLRGTGLATLGAQINLVAYWVIGLPLGMALTFSKLQWELYGLWTGLTVALVFTAIASSIVIFRINWQRVVNEAKAREASTVQLVQA